jgi:plasmid maintenance system antidote protein VapI
MEMQNLSSSAFASDIGVQRSSVSHVLSGRNKPSLDFVVKIKDRFPDVNLEWLISGKGGMLASKEKKETIKKSISSDDIESRQKSFLFEKDEIKESKDEPIKEIIAKDEPVSAYGLKSEKPLKKIILLYYDNTFDEFLPNK